MKGFNYFSKEEKEFVSQMDDEEFEEWVSCGCGVFTCVLLNSKDCIVLNYAGDEYDYTCKFRTKERKAELIATTKLTPIKIIESSFIPGIHHLEGCVEPFIDFINDMETSYY